MLARHVQDRVVEALNDTRVVVVQGARQVGKTTLVEAVLKDRSGRLVSLDDPTVRAAAELDPVAFLSQHRASKAGAASAYSPWTRCSGHRP